jgi:hypothetical protein
MSSAYNISLESAVTLLVVFNKLEVRISIFINQNLFNPWFRQCLFSKLVKY